MLYDELLDEAFFHGVVVEERPLRGRIKGLYGDKTIWINQSIPTRAEKACVLAEELGHFYTTAGDIFDNSILYNRKKEKLARTWAYERLVPLKSIVQAYLDGIRNRYEFAEYLSISEEMLDAAIKHYQEKYGICTTFREYNIYFDPLGVIKMFE